MKVSFVMYADFECILTPISTCNPSPIASYTKKYQHHEATSYCLYTTRHDDQLEEPITYFGPDAAHHFVNTIENESTRIADMYSVENKIPMHPLTEEENRTLETVKNCHFCNQLLKDDRVLDHDHLTGKFRGVAHNIYNLHYEKPRFIPVFIHNLSGYDTHIFIKMFGLSNETIQVIPNNEERYISYTVSIKDGIELRFLDSIKFMSSSLDNLVKNLKRDQFVHTSKHYLNEQLDLLLRKDVYPYDYMDNFDKFHEASLPTKEKFYNKLNRTDISEQDYAHASRVWSTFHINNMEEYSLLYNKSDVLLLADVMENFRNLCMKTYQVDPAWYFTGPGLAWSAMLKTTGVQLDPLTDYDMILMITKGIRGRL